MTEHHRESRPRRALPVPETASDRALERFLVITKKAEAEWASRDRDSTGAGALDEAWRGTKSTGSDLPRAD
jgi:hypothetical protein